MTEVREAVFVPDAEGGELTATMVLGGQDVTATWHVGREQTDLAPLIQRLMVRIDSFTLAPTPEGGEVRVTLNIGNRTFVTRLPVSADNEGRQIFDQLLHTIGQRFVSQLQSALDHES